MSSSLLTVPLVFLSMTGQVQAMPGDGTVVSGQADINSVTPSHMQITQGSNTAIINWQGFSIANGETVQFIQPGQGSLAVNRVLGDDPSNIFGSLIANGQIMLINPNGVLFGPSSRVDVGSLIATTIDIDDEKIINGNFQFDKQGNPSAAIVNQGTITAADGGLVALVAPGVSNAGVIQARLGKVQLAGAKTFSVDLYGDGLISLPVTTETVGDIYDAQGNPLSASVSNSGTIKADGGQVVLSARTAKSLVDDVVNMSGMIEAKSVHMKDGVIVLDGGARKTRVSGTINASGREAGQKGGKVKIIGDQIAIDSGARIDASGDAGGGTVHIGGEYQGKGTTPRATKTTIAADTIVDVSAGTNGNGGEAIVWADDHTDFGGTILATGGSESGNGGLVETSGKETLSVREAARVNASSVHGEGGLWLLDPRNVYLVNGSGANVSGGGTYTPSTDDAQVNIATINMALSGGTSVTITTNDMAGGQVGNITLTDALNATPTGSATLTLIANNNIILNNSISSTGSLNLVLTATGNIIQNSGSVSSGGGNITLNAADIQLSGTGINAGAGTIQVNGANGATIALGAGAGAMSLSAAELAMMSAGILKIGNASAGAITIGADITPGASTFHLHSGSTITGTAGGIIATNLALQAGGAINITDASSNVTNLGISTTGTATFTDTNAMNIGSVNGVIGATATTLTLNAGGALTDSHAILATTLVVTATGAVTLDTITNNVANLGINAGANAITYVDANGFDVTGLTGTVVTLTGAGVMTDSGNIIANDLIVTNNNTVTFNSAGNNVVNLNINAGANAVTYVDSNALNIAALTASTATITSGALTDSGSINATTLSVTATGAVTLDTITNNVANLGINAGANAITYVDANGFDVTGLTGTVVTLTGAGVMTDSGNIIANDLIVTNNNTVTFNSAGNNVVNLNINAGANAVTYVDSNALNIAALTASTATITSGALTDSGSINAATLNITATGAVALDSAGSVINTLSVSAAGQTVNYTDPNGIDLAGITAGTFNLNASGAITDSAALIITNLNIVNTTGATTLDFASNDVDNLNVAAGAQTVTFRDADGINLAGITAGTLSIQAGGAITDSAATVVTNLSVTNTAGATTLDFASNDIDNLTISAAGQTIAVTDIDGINLSGGSAGTLTIIAGGPVTDSGATTATNLNVTSTGTVTLDAANDAGNLFVSAAGQTVTYNDINGLNLAGITAATFNLTTGGAIADTLATIVTDLNITSGGAVVMDVATNNAANIIINAGANAVTYVDANALAIAGLTAGTANITANGLLTDTGTISAGTLNVTNTGGATVLDNVANNINTFSASAAGQNVTFNDANAIDIAGVTANSFTLTAGGAVTDSGNIIVTTLDVTAGGTVTLNNANNVANLDIDAGSNAITFVDTNGFDITGLVGGVITLTGAGVITDTGTITGTTLNITNTGGATTLNSAGNDINNLIISAGTQTVTFVDVDDVNLGGVAAGTLNLTTGSAITDSAATIVTNLNITNTSASTILDFATNDVDNFNISAAGQAVTFRDANGINLAGITAGSLALQAGGAITDSLATVVSGTTSITAGTNAVTLDIVTNNFNDVTIVSAGATRIDDMNAVTLNASTMSGALTVNANSGITVAGNVTANGVTMNSDLDTNGTGDLTINGGAVLNGNNNAITLTLNDLVSSGTINSGSAATTIQISDGGTIDLGNGGGADVNFTAAELAAITAATLKIGNVGAGAITVSSDITPGATTLHLQTSGTITATAGGIVVNNLALQAGGAVNFTDTTTNVVTLAIGATGQTVTFNDASGFDVASVNGVVGINAGTINLNANGALTDSAAIIGTNLNIINTGGATTLDTASNDVVNLNVTGGSQIVTFRDVNALNLAGITAGTLNITTGGTLGDSVAMQIANLNITSGGAVTLNEAANDFDNLFVSAAGQTAIITDADDINLAGITAGTLTLTANGAVTDTLATIVTNLNVTTTGAVTLDTATNNAAVLMISAAGQAVTYRDTNGLDLAGITADTFNLQAGGAITDSAATIVTNLGIATTGAVALDFAGTDADVIAINAGAANNITFVDTDGVEIGTVSAVSGLNGSVISLNTGGAVSQTQAITGTSLGVTTASGGVVLTHASNNVTNLGIIANAQAVSYTDANSVTIANVGGANGLSAGSLDIIIGGTGQTLGDSAALVVTGHTNITAGTNAVTLDMATNNFGTVDVISAGATTIADANAIEFTNINGSGAFTANAVSGITLSGNSVTNGATAFNADSNNDGNGVFTLNASRSITTSNDAVTISGGDLVLDGTIATGTATTAVQATGNRTIDLGTGGGGQFNVSQIEVDRISAGVIRIGGAASGALTISSNISAANSTSLHLQSASTITGIAGGIIEDNLALQSSGGAITITNTSTDVNNLAITTTNQNVTFYDADGINFGNVSGMTSSALGTGTLLLTANGAVTDGHNITGGNLGVTSTGVITLNNNNNFNNIAFSAAGLSVTYNDTNAINIGTVGSIIGVTANTFNLTSASVGITDSSASTITGHTTLTASAGGNIALDLTSNDFNTLTVTNGAAVTIRDANALTINNSTTTGVTDIGANNGLTIAGNVTAGGALMLSADVNADSAGTLSILAGLPVSTAVANAAITLAGADIVIDPTASVNSGTATTTLQATGTANSVDIGGGGAVFNVSQAEINRITAGALRIASGSGGNLTVNAPTLTASGTTSLHLQGGSGGVNTSGAAITITSLALQASGTGVINATNAGNNVDNLAITTGSGIARYVDLDGVNIGTVNGVIGLNGTTIGVTAAGITDSSASTVTNLALTSTGAIILDSATNNFGTIAISAAGQDVTLTDTNALIIGQVNTGSAINGITANNLTLTVGGILTDTQGSVIANNTSITAGANAVTLDHVNNNFNSVSIVSAGNTRIDDVDAITIGGSNVGGTLAINANNGITVGGNVTTTGAATFDADLDNNGSGTFTVDATRTVNTTNTALRVIANDIALNGNLNSGSADTTIEASNGQTMGIGDTARTMTIDKGEMSRITANNLNLGGTTTGNITFDNIAAADVANIANVLNLDARANAANIYFVNNPSTVKTIFAEADDSIYVDQNLTSTVGQISLTADVDGAPDPNGDQVYVSAGVDINAAADAIFLSATGITIGTNVTVLGPLIINADTDNDGIGSLTINGGITILTNNNDLSIIAADFFINGIIDAGSGRVSIETTAGRTIGVGDAAGQAQISKAELARITAGQLYIGGVNTGNVRVDNVTTMDLANVSGLVTFAALFNGAGVFFDNADSSFVHGMTATAENGVTQDANVTTGGIVTIDSDINNDGDGNYIITATHTLNSGGNNIDITANDMTITGAINAGAGTTTILASDLGTIGLGGAGGNMNLSAAELGNITASTLRIGDAAHGAITVSADTTFTNVDTLLLRSGAGVTATAGGIVVDNLGISAGGAVNFTDTTTNVANLAINTTTGNITFRDADAVDITTVGGITGMTTGSGGITVRATDMNILQAMNAGAGTVTLEGANAATIGLGGAGGALNLTNTELNRITANTLHIGTAGAGAITLSDDVTLSTVNRLELQTASGVTGTAGGVVVGDLAIAAGGAVTVTDITTDVNTLSVAAAGQAITFFDNDDVTVSLTGASADISANSGITVAADFIGTGASSFNADADNNGSGAFVMNAGVDIATGNNALNITARDLAMDATATTSSGSGITTLLVSNGGTISLGGAGGNMAIDNTELNAMTAGTLRIGDATAGAITIAGDIAAAGTNTLHLATGSTITGTAGGIVETNLALEAGGTINITDATTDVTNLAIAAPGQNVIFHDATGIDIATVDGVVGINAVSFTLNAGGAVTDSAAITAGTVDITSTGAITLDAVGTDIDNFGATATGQTVALTDVDGVNLNNVTAGTFTLNAGGAVTDTGTVAVGTLNVTTSTGGIVLNSAANDADNINLTATGQTVTFTDADGFNVNGIAGQTITLTAGGPVTDSGAILGQTLNITGSGPVTLDFATNDVDDLYISAPGQTVLFQDVDDLNLTGVAAGSFTVTTGGALTDSGAITAAAFSATSAGPITLDFATNDVDTLYLSAAGNTVTFVDADGFDITGLTATTANLTAGGAVTDTGTITATNLNITGTGSITLNSLANDVDNLYISAAGQSVVFVDADGLNLAGITASTANVQAGGAVTDSAPIVVGDFTLTATGPVTLDVATNDVDNLGITASGQTVAFTDADGFNITGLTANAATLTAAGPITDSGAVTVGTLDLSTSTGGITLDFAANDVDVLVAAAAGQNVIFTDADGIDLAGITAGTFTLNAGGAVTDSQAIVAGTLNIAATGPITLDMVTSDVDNLNLSAVGQMVSFTDADDVNLTGINAGTFTLNAGGAVTDTGAITAANLNVTATGGGVTLDSAANDVDNLFISNGGQVATFVDADGVNLAGITASTFTLTAGGAVTDNAAIIAGTLNVTATGGPVTLDFASNDVDDLSVSAAGQNATFVDADGINLAGITAGNFTLTAGGAVTDSAATNTGALNIAATGPVTLDAANDADSLSVSAAGQNVTFNDTDGLDLAGMTAANLNLTVGGALTDSLATTATGITTINAANGDVTLDHSGNDFNAVAVQSGGNVSLADTNAVTLNNSSSTGTFNVYANNGLTVAGNVNAAGGGTLNADTNNDGTGNFTVDSGATVLTTNSPLTVIGRDMAIDGSLDAGAGTVTLLGTNGGTISLGGAGGDLALSNAELDAIVAGILRIGDATSGAITIVSDIAPANTNTLHLRTGSTITGTAGGITETNLALEAGTGISLTDTTTDIGTLAAVTTTGTMTIVDNGLLTIGSVDGVTGLTATGGNLSLTAGDYNIQQPINNGANITTLVGAPAGTISLGGTSGAMALTNAELNAITAGILRIGSAGAGAITVESDIAPAGTGTLHLITAADITGTAGGITVTNLALEAGTGINVTDATSNVGTLGAITTAGNLTFYDTGLLTVGTVDGVVGLTATAGDISLRAGDYDIQQAINSGTGVVSFGAAPGTTISLGGTSGAISFTNAELNAITASLLRIGDATSGAITIDSDINPTFVTTLHLTTGSTITGTAGGITVNNLALEAGGAISITDTTTDVANLAVNAAGQNVTFRDATGVNIGTVDGVVGVNAGTLNLTTGAAVTDSAAIVTGTLNVTSTGAVTLDAVGNNTNDLTISAAGQAVTYIDLNGFNISGLTADTAALTGAGAITDSGTITAATLSVTNTGGPTTLDTATNDVDSLSISAAGQNVTFVDQDGLDINGLVANIASLTTGGVLTQSNVITANTLNVVSTGAVTLTNVNNNVDALSVNAAGQTVAYTDTNGVDLTGITAGTFTLNAGGSVTDSGTITTGTLTVASTGPVTLNTATNDVDILNINAGAQPIVFVDQDGFDISGLTGSSAALNAGGAITDSGTIAVGALDITSTGPVTLNTATNNVNDLSVSAPGQAVLFVDQDGLNLAGVTASAFTLVAGGAVTDSVANIVGTLNVTSPGAVTLDHAGNDFDAVTISAAGQTVIVNDLDGIDLAGIAAGTFTLTAGGAVTDSAAIIATNLNVTSTGPITLDFATNDVDNLTVSAAGQAVAFTDADGINLAGVTAGTFTLNAGGAVTDSAATVAGTLNVTSPGSVTLDFATNDADIINISAAVQNVTFVDQDGFDIAGLTADVASLTAAGAVTDSGAITVATLNITNTSGPTTLNTATNDVDNINVNAAGQNFTFVDQDGLSINGLNANNAILNIGGALTQSGIITAGDLTISGGGAITLTNAGNDVDNLGVSAAGQIVSFRDADDINLTGVTADAFTLNAGGAVTDSGALVAATLNVTSAGAVTLNTATNDVDALTINAAGQAIVFVDQDGFDIAGLNGSSAILTAGGAVTDSGTITAGTFSVTATGPVTLDTASNDVDTLTISAAGQAATFTDTDGVDLAGITASSFVLNAGGAVTDSGAVVANTLNVTATGPVTLDFASNDADTLTISAPGQAAAFTDIDGLDLAGITASSFTLNAGGAVTDSAAITAGTANITTTGPITLDFASNDIDNINFSAAGQAITYVDSDGFNINGLNGASATLTSGGAITDTGTTTVGTLNITSTGSVTLDTATNDIDNFIVSAAGQNVSFTDIDGINLAGITAGALTINANGAVTDSAPSVISGATSISAGAANNVTLDAANDLNSIAVVSGNNVNINDINAVTLAGSAISGALNMTANDGITQSGNVNVSGNATFDADLDNNGVGDFTINGGQTLSVSGSALNITANDVVLNGAIANAGGTTTILASDNGTISLGGAGGDMALSAAELNNITASTLRLGDASHGAITVAGNIAPSNISTLHLRSGGAVTGTAGAVDVDNLAVTAGGPVDLSHAANDMTNVAINAPGQTVSFRDANAANITTVDGVAGITGSSGTLQTGGALSGDASINTPSLNITSGGTVSLATATNNVTDLGINAAGQTVSFLDAGGVNLTGVTAGNLNLTTSGAVTDSGTVAVSGTTTIAAGAGNNITLDTAANDFGTVAVTSGRNVTLRDTNGMTIGASTISGTLDAAANNGVTIGGAVTTAGATTIDSDFDNNGSGAFTVNGGASLNTNGNPLNVTAFDYAVNGTINSGAAGTTFAASTPGRTWGLGNAAGNITLSGAELQNITAASLTVGGADQGTITVDNVTAANSAGIGQVNLNALGNNSMVRFINNASTFRGLSANADAGIDALVNITTTTGGLSLNGDYDDADDAGSDAITYGSGVTLTGGSALSLQATTGGGIMNGTLNLASGAGGISVDKLDGPHDLNMTSGGNINITDSIGGVTPVNNAVLAAGNTITGDVNVQALTVDSQAAILTGTVGGLGGEDAAEFVVLVKKEPGPFTMNGFLIKGYVPPPPPVVPSVVFDPSAQIFPIETPWRDAENREQTAGDLMVQDPLRRPYVHDVLLLDDAFVVYTRDLMLSMMMGSAPSIDLIRIVSGGAANDNDDDDDDEEEEGATVRTPPPASVAY